MQDLPVDTLVDLERVGIERLRLELDQQRVATERARLDLDRQRHTDDQRFLRRHFGALISAAVSLAGVALAASQVWVAKIEKERQAEAAAAQQRQAEVETQRRWGLDALKFVTDHSARIFSDDAGERERIRNVMLAALPPKVAGSLFEGLAASVAPAERQLWQQGQAVAARLEVTRATGYQWVSTAPEYPAVVQQVFRLAEHEIGAQPRPPGRWAVVADLDETLLSSAGYYRELAQEGRSFSIETFTRWAQEARATPVPGAVAFAERVRSLGGHLIVVSGRSKELCPAAEQNLRAVGIVVSAVLCREPGQPNDKARRWEEIRERGVNDLPPLSIEMWIGDSVRDVPPTDMSQLGIRYFVLPNPMYGEWERVPAATSSASRQASQPSVSATPADPVGPKP